MGCLLSLPRVTKAHKVVGPELGPMLGNVVAVLEAIAVDAIVVPYRKYNAREIVYRTTRT